MSGFKRGIITCLAVLLCVTILADSAVASGWEIDFGDYPWPQDWIWLDVIVNIANGSSTDKQNLAMATSIAGSILMRAGIHINVKDVNDSAHYGDSDPGLTSQECNDAMDHGERELDRICGPGKGVKITFGDIDDPGNIPADVVGLNVHETPVIIVEPNTTDVNELGKTIAHELCHALTIEFDLYGADDVNNLMWWREGSGTELDPNQMEEIRGTALSRGRRYPLEGWNWWRPTDPWGLGFWPLDADGAELDDVGDARTADGEPPDDRDYLCADMRAASVFCEGAGQSDAMCDFTIRLGGEYPQETSFTAVYDIGIRTSASGNISDPDILLQITVESKKGVLSSSGLAQNFLTGDSYDMAVRVAFNKLLGCPGGYVAKGNSSIHTSVPGHFLWPDSKSATRPLQVFVSARTDMSTSDNISGPVLFDSMPGPFEFGIANPAQCPSIAFGCLGATCRNDLPGENWNTPPWPSDLTGVDLIGVFGKCFDSDVVVKLDYREVGTAPIDADGRAAFWVDPKSLGEGLHTVVMQEAVSGPRGRRAAAGLLSTTPPLPGDVNGDRKVDFRDLAIMAAFWLNER